MDQIPFWESDSQETALALWTLTVYYRVHKCTQLNVKKYVYSRLKHISSPMFCFIPTCANYALSSAMFKLPKNNIWYKVNEVAIFLTNLKVAMLEKSTLRLYFRRTLLLVQKPRWYLTGKDLFRIFIPYPFLPFPYPLRTFIFLS